MSDYSQFPAGLNIRAVYLTKIAVLVTILVAVWSTKWFVSPSMPATPITLLVLLALIPTVAVAAVAKVPPSLLVASFAADIVAITAGIHFGGGIDQVSAPLLYTAVIGLVGLVWSERGAFAAAAISAAAYAAMVWAEHAGLLAHLVADSRPPDRQAATVIMVGVYLLVMAWLIAYVVGQIHASYGRAEQLRVESVSALSHDLKNPLAIIHGYAEMIQDAGGDERIDYARRIQRSVQQALDLVRNVLDASAIDAKPISPDRVPLNLNELAGQACEHYRPAADAKGVRLSTVFAMGLPAIEADPQLLSRAIGNLVSNAVKYTDQGGGVEMVTGMNGTAVTITVRDTGTGIAQAEISQLFEKHSPATSAKRSGGTGLGLYIVRRIAEAHGGTIAVDSAVGRGSTFVLALPIRRRNGLG
ncbi:MAG TPA: HAMP domain-containing sensor histidine kinase [Candidatus Kryptonia bacterium]|nr:HAMP domain-containing sensor histidine kinase [Candidatus Kryptonia bacterium]